MKATPAVVGRSARATVLGALFLTGCQGVKQTFADGGRCSIPASVSADGFVEAYKATLCCWALGCDSWTSAGLDACRTSESSQAVSGLLALPVAAGIDAGTITIDTTHAVACLEALSNLGCSGQTIMPLECRAAIVGQPLGGACLSPFDCAEGSCQWGPSGCFGVCTAAATCNGSPCSVWETCNNGLCGPGIQAGETCVQNPECAVGLVCGPRVCVAPGPAGTPCTADDQCLPGTFCGASSGQRVCTPQLAIGAECGGQHSPIACGFGSYCSNQNDFESSGVCMAYGDLGEPCVVVPHNSGFATCLEPLYCRSDGVCEAPPESGPCVNENLCALGDYCDAHQQCQPLRQPGDPCDEGAPEFGCASGDCTSAFVCAPPRSICG